MLNFGSGFTCIGVDLGVERNAEDTGVKTGFTSGSSLRAGVESFWCVGIGGFWKRCEGEGAFTLPAGWANILPAVLAGVVWFWFIITAVGGGFEAIVGAGL